MLATTIESYPYWQYAGDKDIAAFFRAYNELSQEMIDWFNNIGLPIYTGDQISGEMLDWVGAGLYGLPRPVLSNGNYETIGLLGTYQLGTTKLGTSKTINSAPYYVTSDDIYKRILTWRFYKGDGFTFNTYWLKRRIMRFLNGTNGTAPNIDNTYQISVTVNSLNQATIRFLSGPQINITTGPLGTSRLGTSRLGGFSFTVQTYPTNQYIQYFISAINSGILELPFQYSWSVIA